MSRRLLCVVAHPDDETLMAGGMIAKWAGYGREVLVISLADGVSSRDSSMVTGSEQLQQAFKARQDDALQAATILGCSIRCFGASDNAMDTYPLIYFVRNVESIIAEFDPSLVVTHFSGDLNIDHQIVSRAVMTACRPLPGSSVKRILMGECPSSTEWGAGGFTPNWFEDVSETFERKLGAMSCYQTELREYPHPRSLEAIRALAMYRGASCGVPLAEAFMLARSVS